MARAGKTSDSPMLIAVTGPTGAGKSTFINLVCGSRLEVGTGLQSCTSRVQTAYSKIDGQKVVLIDTPGFDDTGRSQADILRDIADYLEGAYEKGKTLAGVIYMHRISDFRMGGIARENFRLISKICGDTAMRNVVIATTMWEDVEEELGASREQELGSKALFFKPAIDHGARMARLYNTAQSAKDLIKTFFLHRPEVLQMQHEIVDEHKSLPDTAAGIELGSELDEKAEKHARELEELRKELREEMESNRQHAEKIKELNKICERLMKKIDKNEEDKRRLKAAPQRGHGTRVIYLERYRESSCTIC